MLWLSYMWRFDLVRPLVRVGIGVMEEPDPDEKLFKLGSM